MESPVSFSPGESVFRQLLRAFNDYYSSSLLPLGLFAVVQQGIYRVPAGFKNRLLDQLQPSTLLYGMFYAGYIALDIGGFFSAFMVVTVAYGAAIWHSLREDVRCVRQEWKGFSG